MGLSMEQGPQGWRPLYRLASVASMGGGLPGDAAYMASVTPEGQVGAWAKLVPAFGTCVDFKRFRIGILEGCATLSGGPWWLGKGYPINSEPCIQVPFVHLPPEMHHLGLAMHMV